MGLQKAQHRIPSRQAGEKLRQISQLQQRPHGNKGDGRHQERASSGQQDAPHEDGHQVQGYVNAVQVPGKVNHGSDQDNIEKDLQIGLKKVVRAELIVDEVEKAQHVPNDDGNAQKGERLGVCGTRSPLPQGELNRKDEGNDQKADLDYPGEPIF